MKIKILLISLIALIILFLITLPDKKTRVIFCNVGQGDGILIEQNNFQMLIDTGPDNKKILSCLEKHMPFWDKGGDSLG
jgi:beta-lactamase superfamily II metal-dependent hydrolase